MEWVAVTVLRYLVEATGRSTVANDSLGTVSTEIRMIAFIKKIMWRSIKQTEKQYKIILKSEEKNNLNMLLIVDD